MKFFEIPAIYIVQPTKVKLHFKSKWNFQLKSAKHISGTPKQMVCKVVHFTLAGLLR